MPPKEEGFFVTTYKVMFLIGSVLPVHCSSHKEKNHKYFLKNLFKRNIFTMCCVLHGIDIQSLGIKMSMNNL